MTTKKDRKTFRYKCRQFKAGRYASWRNEVGVPVLYRVLEVCSYPKDDYWTGEQGVKCECAKTGAQLGWYSPYGLQPLSDDKAAYILLTGRWPE